MGIETIIGGVIGAVGSIIAAKEQQKGAQQAANTQADSQQAAINAQLMMYNQTRADQLPFMQAAQSMLPQAMNTANQAFGLYPQMVSMATNYQNSPITQLQLQEGSKQINQQMMARGLYNSGAAADTLSQFDQRVLATQADKQWNQLTQVYGAGVAASPLSTGASATTALGAQGTQTGTGIAASNIAGGNSLAQLQYAMGQQRSNMYTGVGNQAMSVLGNYGLNGGNTGGGGGGTMGNLEYNPQAGYDITGSGTGY